MYKRKARYLRHWFPPELISYAIWVYHRFYLSFRDIEDLLAERGVIVTFESIRRWCVKFGAGFERALRRCEGRLGDHWYADEVFVNINGQRHYIWRAIDQVGDMLDILVQHRRDLQAAKRFFYKVLSAQTNAPNRLFSDKLGSY